MRLAVIELVSGFDRRIGEIMTKSNVPALAGIHHLKLPVTNLARSLEWYRSRLGYHVEMEFVEKGELMGYAMAHPNGGLRLALRLDPERAQAAAGFDYFCFGVPRKAAIDDLASCLTAQNEPHAGVHWARIGWILPSLHDPDGHEIRFYTVEQHADLDPQSVTTINDPRFRGAPRRMAACHRRSARIPRSLMRVRGRVGKAHVRPCPGRSAGCLSEIISGGQFGGQNATQPGLSEGVLHPRQAVRALQSRGAGLC
jgi:catechol 2,3-dioxygenase-like lactoylglutathione lyase family enzyme